MKIIIAGSGEVGFHLAKLLSFESQDIILIDVNRESLIYASTHLDIRVVRGNATSISVLKDAFCHVIKRILLSLSIDIKFY